MPFRRTSIDSNQRTGFYSPKRSRVVGSRVVGYDPDAFAYFTAVEAADGQALEGSVKDAYNAFVVGCKADGIWTAIKSSCILAGARTLSGALVPLVGTAPTNNSFVSGDYNRETGLVGNGSTKYLNSNRNNNADPQNSKHLAVNLNTAMSGSVAAIGAQTASPSCQSLIFSNAGALDVRLNSTTAYFPAASNLLGFLGVSRSSSATIVSRSSSTTESSSNSSTSPNSLSTFIFARNLDGSPSLHTSARCNFYSIGENLNLALLDTRVTRLLNEIEFFLNTGLSGTSYNINTLKYINAGYAAGGSLS